MAEGTESKVGKFTIIENSPSETSKIFDSEVATKEGPTSPEDSVESFTLKTSQSRRRGKQATPKKPLIQTVSETPANYNLWAQLLIGSTNTVVVTWLGAECAMERREAEMLEPPVARIMQRLTPEQAQKVSVFIDPMVILIALGTWGNRIIRIQRGKRQTISQEELARAAGVTQEQPTYQQPPEPEMPRQKVEVNPNGIPVAITQQMGEV